MRRLFLVALVVPLAVVVVAAGWLFGHARWVDLPRPEGPATLVSEQAGWRDGRWVRRLVVDVPGLGRSRIVVSLPEPEPRRALPVVVVLGGMGRGEANIAPVGDAADNALVGFDWPLAEEMPRGAEWVVRWPDAYRAMLAAPGQIAAILGWLADRQWTDPDRVSLLGYSLGALVAPAAQRLAEADGAAVRWTILAYGGAPLDALVAAHPRLRPDWLGPVVGTAAAQVFRPIEPARHLPHLSGRFLVLAGSDDRLIPQAAAERFWRLAPARKERVVFDGDHMGVGPGQQALLDRIVAESRTWLVTQGAVNPP